MIVFIIHCNTEANKVAHELATLARFSLISDWFEEPLNEIVMILTNGVGDIPRGMIRPEL